MFSETGICFSDNCLLFFVVFFCKHAQQVSTHFLGKSANCDFLVKNTFLFHQKSSRNLFFGLNYSSVSLQLNAENRFKSELSIIR